MTLGLTESYTTGLKRMVARCVGLGSYQLAQDNLAELCQIYLSPKTEECLDIYHGAEHISDCGKVLFGVPQDSKDWFERMRLVLISEGFSGMERELGRCWRR